MDEKERARMITDAISGLTYREWQAVVKAVDRCFHRELYCSMIDLVKVERDIGIELVLLP